MGNQWWRVATLVSRNRVWWQVRDLDLDLDYNWLCRAGRVQAIPIRRVEFRALDLDQGGGLLR